VEPRNTSRMNFQSEVRPNLRRLSREPSRFDLS